MASTSWLRLGSDGFIRHAESTNQGDVRKYIVAEKAVTELAGNIILYFTMLQIALEEAELGDADYAIMLVHAWACIHRCWLQVCRMRDSLQTASVGWVRGSPDYEAGLRAWMGRVLRAVSGLAQRLELLKQYAVTTPPIGSGALLKADEYILIPGDIIADYDAVVTECRAKILDNEGMRTYEDQSSNNTEEAAFCVMGMEAFSVSEQARGAFLRNGVARVTQAIHTEFPTEELLDDPRDVPLDRVLNLFRGAEEAQYPIVAFIDAIYDVADCDGHTRALGNVMQTQGGQVFFLQGIMRRVCQDNPEALVELSQAASPAQDASESDALWAAGRGGDASTTRRDLFVQEHVQLLKERLCQMQDKPLDAFHSVIRNACDGRAQPEWEKKFLVASVGLLQECVGPAPPLQRCFYRFRKAPPLAVADPSGAKPRAAAVKGAAGSSSQGGAPAVAGAAQPAGEATRASEGTESVPTRTALAIKKMQEQVRTEKQLFERITRRHGALRTQHQELSKIPGHAACQHAALCWMHYLEEAGDRARGAVESANDAMKIVNNVRFWPHCFKVMERAQKERGDYATLIEHTAAALLPILIPEDSEPQQDAPMGSEP